MVDKETILTQKTHNRPKQGDSLAKVASIGAPIPGRSEVTITGYACACLERCAIFEELGAHDYMGRLDGRDGATCCNVDNLPPTRPALVLDPFGGTGTTALVAKALGRHGISVDMSADYCRLAEWRTNDRDQLAKVLGVAKAEQQDADQAAFDFEVGA